MGPRALLLACAWALMAPFGVEGARALERVETGRVHDLNTIIFSTVDLGSSVYTGSGFKRPLGHGIEESGFMVMGSAGAGTLGERRLVGRRFYRVDHVTTQGSLVLGYQWLGGGSAYAVYAGVEADARQPTIAGRALDKLESAYGLRLQAEAWLHPTPKTLFTASLVAGTARPHLWAQASWGYDVWNGLHVGPEGVVSLEENYRETRIGLHATGIRVGGFTSRVSGGFQAIHGGQPGGYATITTWFKL